MNANQFEYIGSLRTEDACEAIIARRFDDGRVYTVKLVRKSGRDAPRLATRLRNEQDAMKVLTMHRASYVNKLWWSFEDDKAMYLVTVSILAAACPESTIFGSSRNWVCRTELTVEACGVLSRTKGHWAGLTRCCVPSSW